MNKAHIFTLLLAILLNMIMTAIVIYAVALISFYIFGHYLTWSMYGAVYITIVVFDFLMYLKSKRYINESKGEG